MTTEIQEIVEKRVPLFFGQAEVDTSEVQFFIDACKRVEKRFGDKPEHLKVVLDEVLFRLRGRAYTMFKDIKIASLKDFYSNLTKKFLPAHSIESLQDKLRHARQGKTESCSDFGNRVQGYALDYEEGVRTKYGEANALPKILVATLEQEAFIRGLHNEAIRTNLSMTTEKNLREQIEMAERVERQLGYTRTNGTGNQESVILKCQLCDKNGHTAKTCRTNTSTHARREIIVPNVTCRYCKRIGHVLEDCITRKAAHQKYQQVQPQLYEPQYSDQRNYKNQRNYQPQMYQSQMYQPQMYQPQVYQSQVYQPQQQNRNQQSTQVNQQTNFRSQTKSPQKQYKNQPGPAIKKLTNDLQKMSINYIEEIDDNPNQQQGNDEGLVEQQQYMI